MWWLGQFNCQFIIAPNRFDPPLRMDSQLFSSRLFLFRNLERIRYETHCTIILFAQIYWQEKRIINDLLNIWTHDIKLLLIGLNGTASQRVVRKLWFMTEVSLRVVDFIRDWGNFKTTWKAIDWSSFLLVHGIEMVKKEISINVRSRHFQFQIYRQAGLMGVWMIYFKIHQCFVLYTCVSSADCMYIVFF